MEALLEACPLRTPALAIADDSGIRTAGNPGRYLIYSLTKTFTAVAVLRLARSLDETVTHGLTIRQLLNHTSGMANYGDDPEYHAAVKAHPDQPWSFEE